MESLISYENILSNEIANENILPMLRYDIFGDPIAQNGNSYFFLSSLRKVMDSGVTRTWDGQRSLDKKRVKELAQCWYTEYKNTKNINIRGSILLCKIEDLMFSSDVYYIVDGQHRFHSAIALLYNNLIADLLIRIDIIIVKNEDQIRNEFVNINKSVPVPVHYLSPSDIINLACEMLNSKFPKCFTKSVSRRPAMNIDHFKDAILNRKILETFTISHQNQLYDLIIKLNSSYKEMGVTKLQDIIGRNNKKLRETIANGFKKCLTDDFLFLGLFEGDNWVNDLF